MREAGRVLGLPICTVCSGLWRQVLLHFDPAVKVEWQLRIPEPEQRAQRIRDIVGVQWAVAVALFNPRGNNGGVSVPMRSMDDFGGDWLRSAAEELGALPCAEDIVDGRAP